MLACARLALERIASGRLDGPAAADAALEALQFLDARDAGQPLWDSVCMDCGRLPPVWSGICAGCRQRQNGWMKSTGGRVKDLVAAGKRLPERMTGR
jgi:hypothetical protein